jgi:uncharacterized protein (DUF2126 family)
MSWMEPVARAAEARLAAAGLRLTLGGEPTYVPLQPDGPEWSICADGPTKLPLARRLARELQLQVWPTSTLIYCPGKRYEGEVNPRWALRLITGHDGRPLVHWPEPCQPGLQGHQLVADQALAWLDRLGERLGVPLHPVPLREPLAPDQRIWAAPLSAEDPDPNDPTAEIRWLSAEWPLEESLRELSGAPGPAGLRLPLQHFPEDVPRQVLTLDVDAEGWEIFLPPLFRQPMEALLQAIADSLEGLAAPRLSGMLPTDCDGQWQVLGITADPGVLEINLPICHSWAEYDGWLRQLEITGQRVGLRSWKATADGGQEGTGGGNHLLWGGPRLEENPFFDRPAWLVGILRYWQHHPVLAYLFSGSGVGPSSQAPRPDEAAGAIFDLELAYRAIEAAEGQPSSEPFGDHRGLIGETLRHLHADRSGNNHRSEISFDKFWNPGAPAGCLGLIEFRAMESLPRVEWSSAIALLWTALAAHLLDPRHRPDALRDWGSTLHDRMLLPSQLWADLEQVLAALAADGLALDPAPYREIWEWRFPPLLTWQQPPLANPAPAAAHGTDAEELPRLELRPALEAWPLICDFPREGGFTSRFIDASLRRFEVITNPSFRRRCQLLINGRPLALSHTGALEAPQASASTSSQEQLDPSLLAVRFRHHRLYPCLHPAIDPHLPLTLVLRTEAGDLPFRLHERGHCFEPLSAEAAAMLPIASDASPWGGRQRPGDVSIDLRLEPSTA